MIWAYTRIQKKTIQKPCPNGLASIKMRIEKGNDFISKSNIRKHSSLIAIRIISPPVSAFVRYRNGQGKLFTLDRHSGEIDGLLVCLVAGCCSFNSSFFRPIQRILSHEYDCSYHHIQWAVPSFLLLDVVIPNIDRVYTRDMNSANQKVRSQPRDTNMSHPNRKTTQT